MSILLLNKKNTNFLKFISLLVETLCSTYAFGQVIVDTTNVFPQLSFFFKSKVPKHSCDFV